MTANEVVLHCHFAICSITLGQCTLPSPNCSTGLQLFVFICVQYSTQVYFLDIGYASSSAAGSFPKLLKCRSF